MRLLAAMRLLLSTAPPLRPDGPSALPMAMTLRPYRDEDRHACLSLYQETAEARGNLRLRYEFEQFLDSGDYLRLVLSDGLQVVAMGGVGIAPSFRWDLAWMVYGIEAPWHRGHGLDGVLVLARVCALPMPEQPIKLVLANVPGSQPAHGRLGFQRQGRMSTLTGTVPLECGAAMLDSATWLQCARLLSDLGLGLRGVQAPEIPL